MKLNNLKLYILLGLAAMESDNIHYTIYKQLVRNKYFKTSYHKECQYIYSKGLKTRGSILKNERMLTELQLNTFCNSTHSSLTFFIHRNRCNILHKKIVCTYWLSHHIWYGDYYILRCLSFMEGIWKIHLRDS